MVKFLPTFGCLPKGREEREGQESFMASPQSPSLSWAMRVSCCKGCDAGSTEIRCLKAVSHPCRKITAIEAGINPRKVLVWKTILNIRESLRKYSLRSCHIPQQREQWSQPKCSSRELFWRQRGQRMRMVYLWHLGKYHRQCSKDLSSLLQTQHQQRWECLFLIVTGANLCLTGTWE